MADNTEKESLDNPTNTQSENSSDEITTTADTEIINPIQETENMEVHHHAHHGREKKNWKSYFWEFLMLFLAVFCGFLAESYHTHLVNKEIEKRNIESFIVNVQKDSANLNSNIDRCQHKIKLIDSLSKLPGDFADTSFQKSFFSYAYKFIAYESYQPDESAFLQMQSSGTLRLIEKQNVMDSILKYQSQNSNIKLQRGTVNNYFDLALQNLIEITDLRKQTLRFNGNNQQMQNYINWKIAEKLSTGYYINILSKQLLYTKSLLPFLRQEYRIDK
jgi:hypothetical protein